jgi:hypothetical protein
VAEEESLYDPFCPSGLSFSGDLVEYLGDYIEDRKMGEDVQIELQAEQEPDMERFRNTYDKYIEKLIRRNKKDIHFSDFRAFASLILGAIFIMIGYTFADRFDTVTAEVISAVGSFAMWAAIALFIETIPTLRYKDRVLKCFSKAEIRYRKPEEVQRAQ